MPTTNIDKIVYENALVLDGMKMTLHEFHGNCHDMDIILKMAWLLALISSDEVTITVVVTLAISSEDNRSNEATEESLWCKTCLEF